MTWQSLDTKSTSSCCQSLTLLTVQVHILSGRTSINISTQNTVHNVTASEIEVKINVWSGKQRESRLSSGRPKPARIRAKPGGPTTSLWGSRDSSCGKAHQRFTQIKNTRKKRDFPFSLTLSHTGKRDEFYDQVRDPSHFLVTQVSADSTSLFPLYHVPK